MNNRLPSLLLSYPAVVVVCLLMASPSFAQQYKPPHNRFGQPDFEGIWQALDPAPNFNLEAHGASLGVPAGKSVIRSPADGRIPYTAAGLARLKANQAAPQNDPLSRCYKPGVPHMMYLPFPFQIVQSKNMLTLMSEYVHNTRFVFLNRKDHFGQGEIDLWNGDSVGHFDGDALVTDVANFHPDVWLDRAGHHAGGATLSVKERFTLIDANTLRYQATLTDPVNFTQPWTLELLLYRHRDADKQILEYECQAYVEGALGAPQLPKVP